MNNELIEKIEALPDDGAIWEIYRGGYWTQLAYESRFTVVELKSLVAALTLANKKLEILQASNDHYADVDNAIWRPCTDGVCERQDYYSVFSGHRNGYDFARNAQEEIARLTEGEND